MHTAHHINGNTWLVTETDAAGAPIERHNVAVRAGGTGEDAIAALVEMQQAISPEDRAAEAAAARVVSIKAACATRIFAVASRNDQMNLASDSGAGLLNADQMTTYRTGLAWRSAMITTCRAMIANPALDHLDEAAWPKVPEGLDALIASI